MVNRQALPIQLICQNVRKKLHCLIWCPFIILVYDWEMAKLNDRSIHNCDECLDPHSRTKLVGSHSLVYRQTERLTDWHTRTHMHTRTCMYKCTDLLAAIQYISFVPTWQYWVGVWEVGLKSLGYSNTFVQGCWQCAQGELHTVCNSEF